MLAAVASRPPVFTAPPKVVSPVESVVSLNAPPMVERKSMAAPEVSELSPSTLTLERKVWPPVVAMEPSSETFAAVASSDAIEEAPWKEVSPLETVVSACAPVTPFSREMPPAVEARVVSPPSTTPPW